MMQRPYADSSVNKKRSVLTLSDGMQYDMNFRKSVTPPAGGSSYVKLRFSIQTPAQPWHQGLWYTSDSGMH